MQTVIDIDDRVYGLLKYFEKGLGLNDKKDGNDDVKTALMRAVINGTPLPKDHGRLIDADALIDSLGVSDRDIYCKAVIEEDAPTIIGAYKAEGSDKG